MLTDPVSHRQPDHRTHGQDHQRHRRDNAEPEPACEIHQFMVGFVGHPIHRFQRHAADRTGAGTFLHDLGIHRAGVEGIFRRPPGAFSCCCPIRKNTGRQRSDHDNACCKSDIAYRPISDVGLPAPRVNRHAANRINRRFTRLARKRCRMVIVAALGVVVRISSCLVVVGHLDCCLVDWSIAPLWGFQLEEGQWPLPYNFVTRLNRETAAAMLAGFMRRAPDRRLLITDIAGNRSLTWRRFPGGKTDTGGNEPDTAPDTARYSSCPTSVIIPAS